MTRRWKGVLLVVLLIAAAFFTGYGLLFGRVGGLEDRVEALEQVATFQDVGLLLAAATIEAQRGNYEPARRQASAFFTGLQQNVDRAPAEMMAELRSILARRDEVITDLSRSNAAVSDTLASMFIRYHLTWQAVHGEETHDGAHEVDTTGTM